MRNENPCLAAKFSVLSFRHERIGRIRITYTIFPALIYAKCENNKDL